MKENTPKKLLPEQIKDLESGKEVIIDSLTEADSVIFIGKGGKLRRPETPSE